ncbi:Very-long-chain (3R)-3-hydroxyacyl-CoA dehydratase PASTICCINO 2 [Gonapodya sp. JEL0774]|nr:Very-long-chain (3R)-3-hydroxyacyl-CoA dehydratase PASTICCINO 2 [Gonapodya sp. JEL0774]
MSPPTDAPARKAEYGIVFPVQPGTPTPKNGAPRSSTWANQEVLAKAVENHDAPLAAQIRKEKNWRKNYKGYYVRMVDLSLKSPETALSIARSALTFCHSSFQYLRPNQSPVSIQEAFSQPCSHSFETRTITGKGTREEQYTIPYGGRNLKGEELLKALDAWVEKGTIEPDARTAVARVVANTNGFLDLSKSSFTFVLFGAGAAMGSLAELLALGARVVAVDVDVERVWKKIAGLVESSAGTVIFPVRRTSAPSWKAHGWSAGSFEGAGCNLITEGPEIKEWLLSVLPRDSSPVLCNYAYLDGPAHVRVSLAMDAICTAVALARPNTTLAYLCTPTDCHVIPRDAMRQAQRNWDELWMSWAVGQAGKVFGKIQVNVRDLVKSDAGDEFAVVDSIMTRQGPNYAFAKRIQHWRAIVARHDWGIRVSSNVAPMTRTFSVTHNLLFRFAYGGAHHFVPVEIFEPSTSTSLMCALLLNDLLPGSAAQPWFPLRNPLELMTQTAAHGGVWRASVAVDSVGEYAAVMYLSDPRNWVGELKRAAKL